MSAAYGKVAIAKARLVVRGGACGAVSAASIIFFPSCEEQKLSLARQRALLRLAQRGQYVDATLQRHGDRAGSGTRRSTTNSLAALRCRRRLQQPIKILVQSCQLIFALTNLKSSLEGNVVVSDKPAIA
jgi:hypothetical protein